MNYKERVIKGLEYCVTKDHCHLGAGGCPCYFPEDTEECSSRLSRAALDLLKEYELRWTPCSMQLPQSGINVLATCEYRRLDGYRELYVCEAFYAAKHSIPAEDNDCLYDDADNENYLREGWYEIVHNADDYSNIDINDIVTHWMPLPEPAEQEKQDD